MRLTAHCCHAAGSPSEPVWIGYSRVRRRRGLFPAPSSATRFFVPVSLRSSAFVAGSAGSTFGEVASFSRQFTLGGPLRLGALAPEEIRTNQYWYGAGGLFREIGSLPPLLGSKLYAAGWYELGHAYGPDSPRGYNHTGSAGLAIETAFGPLFLGGSIGQTGRGRLYFMLGRLF